MKNKKTNSEYTLTELEAFAFRLIKEINYKTQQLNEIENLIANKQKENKQEK